MFYIQYVLLPTNFIHKRNRNWGTLDQKIYLLMMMVTSNSPIYTLGQTHKATMKIVS